VSDYTGNVRYCKVICLAEVVKMLALVRRKFTVKQQDLVLWRPQGDHAVADAFANRCRWMTMTITVFHGR